MKDIYIQSAAEAEAVLISQLVKAMSGKIRLRIFPSSIDDSNSGQELGTKFHHPKECERYGKVYVDLRSTTRAPYQAFGRLLTNSPMHTSYLDIFCSHMNTNSMIINPSVSNVIYGDNLVLPHENSHGHDSLTHCSSEADYQLSPKYRSETLEPDIIPYVYTQLLKRHANELNNKILMGSGNREPTGVYTAAEMYCKEHSNRIPISTQSITNPGSLTLDCLKDGLDLLDPLSYTSPKCAILMNRQFSDMLSHNSICSGELGLFRYRNRDIDAIRPEACSYLGRRVYDEPELAAKPDNKAKLGVGGDFSKFWVFLGEVEISTNMQAERPTIMLSQSIASDLVSPDNSPSLFYIEGDPE